MLTPAFFDAYRVLPSERWERAVRAVVALNLRLSNSSITVSGLERLPARPALLATNSTQKYDFLALRFPLFSRGVRVVTVTKGKNYHSPAMAALLGRTGVVPLASRGYLILADFLDVVGRRPSVEEYRALRDQIDDHDGSRAWPSGPPFDALGARSRRVLGHPYDPASAGYGAAMRATWRAMMRRTLSLAEEAVRAGYHVQMYPEGTVSPRLSAGRIGAVQLARALSLPIVPIGMSGCPETFAGATPLTRGGRVHIEIGAPWSPPAEALPADFEPFDPASEARHRATLQALTEELMGRLDGLVDARHKRDPAAKSAPPDLRKHL